MKALKKTRIMEKGAGLDDMVRETEGLGPPDPNLLLDCGDGELRPIITYPSPRLREMAGEVPAFDEELRKLVSDMAFTMYTVNGIGLAAPQIGVPARVFLVDIMNGVVSENGQPPAQLLVAVNPKIWAIPGKTRRDAERCLSFPDTVELITRPSQIVLKAYNHHGKPYALGCGSDLARAIQHEYDHLEGKLLIDYMEKNKAKDLRSQLKVSSRKGRQWAWT